MVKVTNGVAVGGLSMPAWYSALEDISQVAGLLVPLLSAGWLVYQLVRQIIKDGKDDDEDQH